MTILVDYVPEVSAVNDERLYRFSFPSVGAEAIEVYEMINVNGTNYRYLVPVTDYTIAFGSPYRNPLKSNGKIQFSRRHSVDTASIVIERNTLIKQTIDFPLPVQGHRPYNGRMVEFAFDKAMMICQEIAERKCNVNVVTPMTQEVVFSAYDDFRADEINFQVNKTFTILAEIAASGEDCTDDLEST